MTDTAAFRLAGPTQSWGTPSHFDHKNTLPYPTLSGILGLLRAAHGIPRTAPSNEWAWMFNLGIAIRIDQPGHIRTDYHTINPRQKILADDEPLARFENTAQIPLGNGSPWKVGGTGSTKLTTRDYVHDAVYTLLITGPTPEITTLLDTVDNPTWTLSLGRKACVTGFPLTLGLVDHELVDAAHIVPAHRTAHNDAPGDTVNLTLHILNDPTQTITGTLPTINHDDRPTGSHALHPRQRNTRQVLTITAPTVTYPELLNWRTTHHPAHTPL